MSDPARSGACVLLGRPNVGKSTLMNALLGQKLAVATPKPQTTRTCLLGVYAASEPPTQIAFVDTPGLHRPLNALGRALVEDAKGGLAEADVVVVMTEVGAKPRASSLLGEDAEVLGAVRGDPRPVILVLNKVDRVHDKRLLLPVLSAASERGFAAVVPLSARTGDNVPALIEEIRRHLPEGLRYDPELFTDKPERFFAAEMVRGAVMRATEKEVPYGAAVRIDHYGEARELTRIGATIIVEREGHKGIVIGKGGQRLKQIGTEARLELEAFLERKVFLELWVKVIPGWTRDPAKVRELIGADAGSMEG
jgi:GTP-binding protein Era